MNHLRANIARTSSGLDWVVSPLNDAHAWNRLLQRINPVWSLTEIRARVMSRIEEDADTVSLLLKPNRHWRGHQAGQHVAVGVEIDGVMRQRVFSLSSFARRDKRLRITFRRQAGQGVTDWLHRHAGPGLVLRLSEPGGQFVLPSPAPAKLLMLAGGSGITPMMAMLGQLAEQGFEGDIVLVQLCRDSHERLFADELSALQQRLPGLRIHAHASTEQGRLSSDALPALVPDLSDRHAYLCGPAAWMAEVSDWYSRHGLSEQLFQERFAAPRPKAAESGVAAVHASESDQTFTQNPGATLLESAEAAGLQPAYGCRAGLCRTCLCQKKTGTVRNLLTGLRSEQADEWVQLCISVAETDVELSL